MRREAQERRDALPAAIRTQAANAIAQRPFPRALTAANHRVRIHAAEERDQSGPADAKAVGRRCTTRVAGGLPGAASRWQCAPSPLAMRWAPASGASASPDPEAPEVLPDILLVPLLAFDRSGHRIGYGGGYYDLTIAALARTKDSARRWHRLRRAGNCARADDRLATPASTSCSPSVRSFAVRRRNAMRILFIGDIVGRSGRAVLLQRLPWLAARLEARLRRREWRKCRRRLRHHRGDLRRNLSMPAAT